MRCRVADDPGVVMKFPPMKPGNGVEGKTGMTCILYTGISGKPKAPGIAKGGSSLKSLGRHEVESVGNKPPDEAGTYRMVPLGRGL